MASYQDHPLPPIARMSGHDSGCYDSCGNYRSCTPGCKASQAWNQQGPDYKAANAAFDADMVTFKEKLVNERFKKGDVVRVLVNCSRHARLSPIGTRMGLMGACGEVEEVLSLPNHGIVVKVRFRDFGGSLPFAPEELEV